MRSFTEWINWFFLLAISLSVGILMADAVRRLLVPRTTFLRRIMPVILFWIALRTPSWIGDENSLFMLLFFLAVFYFCYTGRRLARVVTGLTFYTLILPMNMMLDSAGIGWFTWDWNSFEGILPKCALYLPVWLLVRRLTQEGKPLELSNRLWRVCGLLILSPLIASLSFSIWNSFSRGQMDEAQTRLAYTILPFSMLSAAALLIALTILNRHEELEKTAQLSSTRELYYESLQRQETQVRTLRHDLRNHLTVLQSLMEQGDCEKAGIYLSELTQSSALHGVPRLCENEIANVVLTNKVSVMEQQGLTADVLVSLPNDLAIADIDLCALLGNALDNAMEAAVRAADRQVLVRARADRGMLMLRVENSFAEKPVSQNGVFRTGKPDAAAHGFGIQGMQEIAERYGGTLETTVNANRFELVVCIPLMA